MQLLNLQGMRSSLYIIFFLILPTFTIAEDKTQSVSALGRLEPQGGIIRIGAPSTSSAISGSLLAELLVSKGDYVNKGDILAVTDSNALLQVGLKRAEDELKLAILTLEAIQSQSEEACVKAKFSKKESERRTNLLKRKLSSEEEAEQALGDAEAKMASCMTAKANIRVAESKIIREQTNVELQKVAVERSVIKAPFKSRVLDILLQAGEFIGSRGILELGRVDRMYAIAEVYETDIGQVKIGQKATIISNVLPEPLYGKVEFIHLKVHKQDEIDTDPAASKDARIIEVEILLDKPELADDLTYLQVEVIFD